MSSNNKLPMPKIKTKRNDILRQEEILETLEKAKDKPWLQCLIAIAWIFGKRINEILKLTKQDIWIAEGYLYIRFLVSKKKTRKDTPTPKPFVKRITLKHPGAVYIIQYIESINEGLLFLSHLKNEQSRRVRTSQYLKEINPKVWWHLFRESLATEMAERGATEEKLMHWFDWDRVDTAHQYVKRGTKLTEELSERTW